MDGDRLSAAEMMSGVSAHQEETRRLVRAMMRLTGLSASGLARAAGLTPSTLNRFMHHDVRHTLSQRTLLSLMIETFGRLKPLHDAELDADALADLAPAVAVFERALLNHDSQARRLIDSIKSGHRPASLGAPPIAAASDDIAVLTSGTSGVDVLAGDFRGAMLKTPRPPFLAGDPNAFAVMMPDASMSPRFEAGDILYVSPARGIGDPGADVIGLVRGGGFLIGRVQADTATIAPFESKTGRTLKVLDAAGVFRIIGSHRP